MNRNLQAVSKFVADSRGAFTEPQIRWHLHNKERNGLAAVGGVVKIGRRIYIDLDGFERWIASQNAQAVV
jgi:hypothetical protein